MVSNYEEIGEENRRRYGTDIGRIGPMLLADRYDDRTHFIFELLQNAEDALSRRGAWSGSRRVTFDLTSSSLALSHFGRPFDELDVRGVCGIAESTKDEFSIGRFGIGFKSVYTFTDRPEIHSGDEDFAVEGYVQPKRMDYKERSADETLIILPLISDDVTAQQEITEGFRRLGPSALLFLQHIDEINWKVEGGASGVYLRSSPESLGPNAQRITVIGQASGEPEIDQNWLVFRRGVFSTEQKKVGRVEVAFSLGTATDAPGRWSVQPVATSPLVAFFPTIVSTNLGFLVQGPYRTTPSRDNVPRGERWNQYLVKETAGLLVEAMRWLRDEAMLDTSALRCLPLDRERFPEGSMFAPLFDAVREAFIQEELLPSVHGSYVAAPHAKLARTQDLRELLSPNQVAALFESEGSTWLSGDITQDRAPEIRQYLMRELAIMEVTPAMLVPRLTREFLEAQSDQWVLRLYEFLSGQEATLRRRLDTIPLIRLSDGFHVVAHENGKPKAFLPSAIETGFPTMRREVCSTAEVRSFLISLGITEPDPVDDVVWNVLPKYRHDYIGVNDEEYAADIGRILAAFSTDSKAQRDKLLSALREAHFVMAVDPGNSKRCVAKPSDIYVATDRLKQLFAGVPGVLMVDDTYSCLRGESARDLLEACGALRYPRPIEAPHALTWAECQDLRRQAGHEATSGINDRVVDWLLQGFENLMNTLPALSPENRAQRAKLIWESLGDLEERRGRGIFEGSYSWSHYGNYRKEFPATFVRRLNSESWVPDANGDLQPASLVFFDALGWNPNPFLLTKIAFKPPIIDQLAKEAGIDPGLLDLLKKHGITSEAELKSRLGITDKAPEIEDKAEPEAYAQSSDDVYDNARDLYGDDMPDMAKGTPDPEGGDDVVRGGTSGTGQGRTRSEDIWGGITGSQGGSDHHGNHSGKGTGSGTGGQRSRSSSQVGCRPFISYVGAHLEEEEPDPDGLDQVTRMRIEERAIALIIGHEPMLRRTPDCNPGFDLYEADGSGKPVRWVEVKSMTGCLEDRPVGLSHTQFDWARERGTAYWLYVVEHATDAEKARVLRIQDPVAHARTFTFDRGWVHIARTDPPS